MPHVDKLYFELENFDLNKKDSFFEIYFNGQKFIHYYAPHPIVKDVLNFNKDYNETSKSNILKWFKNEINLYKSMNLGTSEQKEMIQEMDNILWKK